MRRGVWIFRDIFLLCVRKGGLGLVVIRRGPEVFQTSLLFHHHIKIMASPTMLTSSMPTETWCASFKRASCNSELIAMFASSNYLSVKNRVYCLQILSSFFITGYPVSTGSSSYSFSIYSVVFCGSAWKVEFHLGHTWISNWNKLSSFRACVC